MIDKSGKLQNINFKKPNGGTSGFSDITVFDNFNNPSPAELPGTYHGNPPQQYDEYDLRTHSADFIWLNNAWVECDIYKFV